MRVQLAYPLVAVILGCSAHLLTACSNDEGNQLGTAPHTAGLEGDDGTPSEKGNGEGASGSSPIANASDAGSSTPAANDGRADAGPGHDARTDDAGSHDDAGENDAGTQCNALARQPTDAPYYVLYNDSSFPDFTSYSGGNIRDGMYVLSEDRSHLGYPRTPDGGTTTGTSWATLYVTGNFLSAVVTDHDGGEVRFNATIELDGTRIYLTPLCGLDQPPAMTSEWRELKFPSIKSGYTATDDSFSIGWMIGNHAAVTKEFRRVQGSQTTWE